MVAKVRERLAVSKQTTHRVQQLYFIDPPTSEGWAEQYPKGGGVIAYLLSD
jgi:hypothetical protein